MTRAGKNVLLFQKGGGLEIGFEISVEATVGAMLTGFSVGSSVSDTLIISSGSSTSYTGVIENINATNFFENQYSFGLFTYVNTDARTGQQYEVIN